MDEKRKRYSAEELRRCIWRAMGALGNVAVADLVGVIPEIGMDSVKKAVRHLEIHGYVAKTGRRNEWGALYTRVRKGVQPPLPPVCGRCGQSYGTALCETSLKKETKKERERNKQKKASERGTKAGAPDLDALIARGAKEPAVQMTGNPSDGPDWHQVPEDVKERLERQLSGHEGRVDDDAA